eukprot:TRINITY_DN49437_c0_g1_i1.p1 TRINITY_DN49437_c0_g1~~TRINITY_DN49437_c0_g1_i1.p1  ORF type:complete len:364 (+),score=50.04 TRINITY_DN49437_c0_g1_i1:42-1133(+)
MRTWLDLRMWAELHGATIEERLEPDGSGGLRLREAGSNTCKDATMLVEVPRSLWLQVEDADVEDEELALAKVLAAERIKGASSFWAPYLQALPTEPASVLALSDAECKMLPFGVRELAADLRSRAFEFASRSESSEHMLWAIGCVWSRAFRFAVAGKRVAALVPLADAFNHADEGDPSMIKTIKGFDGHDFYVGTQAAVDPDMVDVAICYRTGATDATLLLQYGFCLESNWHAEAAIDLHGVRLVFLTAEATGVLVCDVRVRLQDTSSDWQLAELDQDSEEITPEERAEWDKALQELQGRAVTLDRKATLDSLDCALRLGERDLCTPNQDTSSFAEHIFRLRESSRFVLRIARGRIPLLSDIA